MNKLIGHFRTITKHRHAVIRNCRRAGILWQGLRHDLSKYSPTEFIPGVKYYVGTRSPNELERADKGYSAAWLAVGLAGIGLIILAYLLSETDKKAFPLLYAEK